MEPATIAFLKKLKKNVLSGRNRRNLVDKADGQKVDKMKNNRKMKLCKVVDVSVR